MLNDSFREILGYNGRYFINDRGDVSNGKVIMKPYKINSGYYCIDLVYSKGKKRKCLVHRLVAKCFLPNPSEKEEVNHKDGDKLNNSVYNLEWVTSEENKRHAKKEGLWVYNKPTKGLKVGSSSPYRYVTYRKDRGTWSGYLRVNGKNVEQKTFKTAREAGLHVNKLIKKYNSDVVPNEII